MDKAEVVNEFIEIESGKYISKRPILKAAIEYAQTHNAVLVVTKLDSLSRDVVHIFKYKNN
ncbi:recombinase family protein [Runella slithyformis]|uniref:recombinase family protein n=1 Tax=Runella slithyformis TaxID=106 RepID=UPI0009DA3D72